MDSIFLKAFFKISKAKPKEKSLLHIWYFFVESKENCCDDLHWMYQLFIPINPAKSIKVFFNPPYESDSHMMNWDFYYFHKSTNNIRVSWWETNRNRDFLSWNINSECINLGFFGCIVPRLSSGICHTIFCTGAGQSIRYLINTGKLQNVSAFFWLGFVLNTTDQP